jgi:hypothetical protein
VKLISFLSAVSLATVFATSGFGNLLTLFESANAMVAHDPNAPDDYSTGTSKSHDMRLRQLEQSQGDAKSPLSPSDIVINSPHGCMEHGFSLEAEFLWWRATLDNLEYAVKGKQSFIAFAGLSLSSEIKGVDFEFDPGVRVSAGFDFGRRNWDIALRWTYHYTSPTGSTGTDNPSLSVIPLAYDPVFQVGTGEPPVANTAKSKWTNQFNALDFEMGYDYFFSQMFSIRPYFGLKAAWIDMHSNSKYTNVLIPGNPNTPFDEVSVRSKSDYWGVGPRVGIDGHLHMGWGFSFYALTSASMLYGAFDTTLKVSNLLISGTTKYNNYYRLRTMAQIATGLRWGWCFSRKYFLSLHLGWETQYWWEQLEMRFAERFEPDADLTFSGLDAGIRFDF